MLIGVIKEKTQNEQRIAISPPVAGQLTKEGVHVLIENNAGISAGYKNTDFTAQGAEIIDSPVAICQSCNMLLKVWAPLHEEWQNLSHMPVVIADFSRAVLPNFPFRAFALEKIPRISRAQNMDILSSQSNLIGYKAVIKALNKIKKCAPMMITAAGTLPPLRIFIWGLGVAGLQAAATAKRLGAKVYASDIRPETVSHAASVGALFIKTKDIYKNLPNFDLIITAAGSFGKSPVLIKQTLFSEIPSQNLIFDISGNVESGISAPNLIRNYNLISELATSASQLYANNIYNFFHLIYDFDQQELNLNFNNPIINATYLGERKNV